MAILFEEYAGMMVHLVWHPLNVSMPITRDSAAVMPGIRMYTSTRDSNQYGYLYMTVHDFPGMIATNVFGPYPGMGFGGIYRGIVREVLPPFHSSLPAEAAQYIATHPRCIAEHRAHLHRGYAGYSLKHRDLSGVYHAVDFYWQDPRMLGTGVYHHYVLVDTTDPKLWYRSRLARFEGQVSMEESTINRMSYQRAHL